MNEHHKLGSKKTRQTDLDWDPAREQLTISQGHSSICWSKDHADDFIKKWRAIRPCSYGNQPHPLANYSDVGVECDTQKRFYAFIDSLVGVNFDEDQAVNLLLNTFEFFASVRGIATIEAYNGDVPQAMDDALVGRMIRVKNPGWYAEKLTAAVIPEAKVTERHDLSEPLIPVQVDE